MEAIRFPLVMALALCPAVTGHAARVLEREEVLQLLRELTEQPRQTWIVAGTIEATHHEYAAARTTDPAVIRREIEKVVEAYRGEPNKRELTEALQKMKLDAIDFNVRYRLANECTMSSKVVVRYDGERFYWEIVVDSRQDSVRPEAGLAGNFMTERFDPAWNGRRVFAWNGREYTTYSASGGQAIVDAAGKLPHAVHGPLTAGLIPWGYGEYTYFNLSTSLLAATEANIAGRTQIELSITHPDGSSTIAVLDSTKDYAVTSAALTSRAGEVVNHTCSAYQLIGSYWVPFNISSERRDGPTNKLLRSEQWVITAGNGVRPEPNGFDVACGPDTRMEHYTSLAAGPSIYLYSDRMDTHGLLAQHLAYVAAQGRQPQNCATAALQRVASHFGRFVPGGELAHLVDQRGRTSLYDMRQWARSVNLHCLAVRTDLATLRDLDTAKVILHFPDTRRLAVLDRVDDRYVWWIDLSSNRLYDRCDVERFRQQWSEGTALLLSDRPISGEFTEIPDDALEDLLGADGRACTLLLQKEGCVSCEPTDGTCPDIFRYYWRRYGCEDAASGTCGETSLIRFQDSPCTYDPVSGCEATGAWEYCYMQACE